jgi:hypothetical protein
MPSNTDRANLHLLNQQRRSQRSFSVWSLFVNPTSLTAVLVFIFAVMLLFTFVFFGLWNTGVSNLGGTRGVWNTAAAQRGEEANNAETNRETTALQNGVTVNREKNKAAIQKKKDDIEAREVLHALHKKNHDLTQEEQGADYNQVSTHATKIEYYSNPFQLTPDIKYKAATCKISEVKDGSFTYCLSPVENHEPRSREQCGFECVPYLPNPEFKSAMDIYKAKDRKHAFETNSVGVKAWFKLFNVIGHHNAKEKFALVFDLKLESICSAMEDVELRELESVQNVCGPFYEKPPPLLSDKPFGLNIDLYQVMQ